MARPTNRSAITFVLKGQLNAVMCLMKDGRWRTRYLKYAMKLMAEAKKHQLVLVCVTYEKKNMAHTLSSAIILEADCSGIGSF